MSDDEFEARVASSLHEVARAYQPDTERARAGLDRLAVGAHAPARPSLTPLAPSDLEPSGANRARASLAIGVAISLLVGTLGGIALGRRSTTSPSTLVGAENRSLTGAGAPTGSGQPPQALRRDGAAPTSPPRAAASYRRLFIRNAGGVAIRAYAVGEAERPCPAGASCPAPPACGPVDAVVAELSNAAAVATASVPALPAGEAASLQVAYAATFGLAEGAPVAWTVLRTGQDVARVRAELGDGTDEMAPAGGWAVLAHASAANAPGGSGGTVEALDASGRVLTRTDLSASTRTATGPACVARPPATVGPAPLPKPDGPPPADVAGARAGVEKVYGEAFTGTNNHDVWLAAVEGGDTLGAALAEAVKNFPEAARTITDKVYDVVFLNDRTAAVRFELFYTGGAEFGPQNGRAVLVNGRWKVSRDTYCMVLGWAGATCPAGHNP
jgi:hypothetical protein